MANINYLSDFKILEVVKTKITDNVPFTWIYSTGNGSEYSASYDGTKYYNCKKIANGKILVLFKNHNLGKGKLSVTRIWRVPDSDFEDGVCKQQSNENIDAMLGDFQSSDITITNVFAPFG